MFCRIEGDLFLSSFEAISDNNSITDTLKTLNIRHVLIIAVESPPTYDFGYCTNNMVVAVYDKDSEKISRYFKTCYNFIKAAGDEGRGVLVTSPDGKSRSVTIVVAYLMMKYNINLEDALEHVTTICHAASPNNGFMLQLQNLERGLGIVHDQDNNRRILEKITLDSEKPRKEPRVEMVAWNRPPMGWAKVNVDGAGSNSNTLSGAGGLIRDSAGGWISGFTTPLGYSCTPLQAELWGVLEGLRLAWDLGLKKVVLETDSRRATQLIECTKNSEDEANAYREILGLIWDMIARDWSVQINHCYREVNMCADWLAKKALNTPFGSSKLDNRSTIVLVFPPPGIFELLLHDFNGSKYPRIFTCDVNA